MIDVKEFYKKRINEDSSLTTVELMEEYAKKVISNSFFNGTPTDFENNKISDFRKNHNIIDALLKWSDENNDEYNENNIIKKDIIFLASKFASKGISLESAMYSDDLYNKTDLIDDIWEYVVEYKEIGSTSFNEKYKKYKLY